jgi:nicotinamide-nucleotide amidase
MEDLVNSGARELGDRDLGDPEIWGLVQKLAASLLSKKWTMAAAESCTGGWIAKCCTDLVGSSAWFDRGFVTYSNRAKQEMLGVGAAVLETEGAVSQATAIAMAEGARLALSVSGIAGPDGGTADKPVGTVWFSWSLEGQPALSEVMQFAGDRDAVRRQTLVHALSRFEELLNE